MFLVSLWVIHRAADSLSAARGNVSSEAGVHLQTEVTGRFINRLIVLVLLVKDVVETCIQRVLLLRPEADACREV